MRFVSAAVAAVMSVALIPVIQSVAVGTANAAGCASQYSVLVGGTGDPNSAHVPFKPAGEVVRVQYPASIWPAGPVSADESVRIGEVRTAAAVADIRARCPGADIQIGAYSLGAWAAGNYCDRDGSVNCTLIADPRKVGGVNAYLPDLPGMTFQGERAPKGNVRQVCGEYDIICSAPANDPIKLVASFIGYMAGVVGLPSTHGYAPQGEPAHDVTIPQASPIPFTDDVPALPIEVPTPRDVWQPAAEVINPVVNTAIEVANDWIVPQVDIGAPYTETTVGDVVPRAWSLPAEVANIVIPPLPALPRIPGL